MSFQQQVQVPRGSYWENPTGCDPVIYLLHKVAFARCDCPVRADFPGVFSIQGSKKNWGGGESSLSNIVFMFFFFFLICNVVNWK